MSDPVHELLGKSVCAKLSGDCCLGVNHIIGLWRKLAVVNIQNRSYFRQKIFSIKHYMWLFLGAWGRLLAISYLVLHMVKLWSTERNISADSLVFTNVMHVLHQLLNMLSWNSFVGSSSGCCNVTWLLPNAAQLSYCLSYRYKQIIFSAIETVTYDSLKIVTHHFWINLFLLPAEPWCTAYEVEITLDFRCQRLAERTSFFKQILLYEDNSFWNFLQYTKVRWVGIHCCAFLKMCGISKKKHWLKNVFFS